VVVGETVVVVAVVVLAVVTGASVEITGLAVVEVVTGAAFVVEVDTGAVVVELLKLTVG